MGVGAPLLCTGSAQALVCWNKRQVPCCKDCVCNLLILVRQEALHTFLW